MSLYNQTAETPILPTPVVAVLGVIDDVTRRTPSGFGGPGEEVWLLGETREELSGSEWAHVVHRHLGGLPPRVDLPAEQALATLLVEASATGVLASAHDVSDGGLAQTLVEAALAGEVGCTVDLTGVARDTFVALFSESVARCVVTVPDGGAGALSDLADRLGVPLTRLGATGGGALVVEGALDVPLEQLRATWTATLPAVLG